MTREVYLRTRYPDDFILIGSEYLPLPKGGTFSIENKEISSTFTAADGTKRKDIIRRYQSVSVKFSALLQSDFEAISALVRQIEDAPFSTRKMLLLKKQTMPSKPDSADVQELFNAVKIDIVQPVKASFTFRKNGLFVYSGVTLKIN